MRFSLTTCPDAQSDDESQPAVGTAVLRVLFPHPSTPPPYRAQGAPSASTVRSTKRCPWRWSCSPGNCSSSVTLARGSSCCRARPSERAARGCPRLHFRPPQDQKGTEASSVPRSVVRGPPRAGSRQVAPLPPPNPRPPLSASQLCSQLPSSACSTPLCWPGPSWRPLFLRLVPGNPHPQWPEKGSTSTAPPGGEQDPPLRWSCGRLGASREASHLLSCHSACSQALPRVLRLGELRLRFFQFTLPKQKTEGEVCPSSAMAEILSNTPHPPPRLHPAVLLLKCWFAQEPPRVHVENWLSWGPSRI